MLRLIGFFKGNLLTLGGGALAGLALGLYLGAAVSKAHYEGVLRAQAEASSAALQDAVDERDKLASRLAAEQERAAQGVEQRAAVRQEAEEVNREIANDPDLRDCEWREPHRLRIERIYGAYGFDPAGRAGTP